ncbi:histidine kinase [Niabella ginsenosidivorans]|uniref:histidine kinase n=1 Tax=Niabella ginsenosidivorans TaxID=1176587 RepID=A0A1A9I0Y1_9BACT|nr:two-component regulator propeller domain-containing protein [Niabella ginsenosidivorans]ANH80729.1 histidine kinase [Niabella ginsenosidivorans]
MKLYLTLIVAYLFAFLSPGYCQEYYFRHFQAESGLSNNTTSCVLQDSKGFIWIGTKDGLDRFDGYNFKIFRNKQDDSTSLGNNSVWKLYEAKNGIIWVGTERGFYQFDPATEKFSFLKNTPKTQVRSITEDADGNVWLIVGFQLYRLDGNTHEVTYMDQEGLQYCSTLTLSVNGQLWVGNMNGEIGNYDKKKQQFTFHSVFAHSKPAVSNWIEKIYDTGEGYFLIGTSNQGIKKFYINDRTYEDLLTYNKDRTEIFARDFVKARNNEFWVATESGIYIYNDQKRQFINLKKDAHNPYAISDNAIYSFCRDKEGGIWVGTYFGGVNYYSNENPSFEKYFPGKGSSSLQGNAVREITADRYHHLWVGTEDAGLNKFDPRTGLFKNFRPDGTISSIANTNIHGLLSNGDHLWIGTFEHGLDIMDLTTEKVIRHFNAGPGPHDLKSNFIHSIYKSRSGRIWLGTSNGIYFYNPKGNNFTAPAFFPQNSFYSSILECSEGTLWAGTFQDGLHYYNASKNIYGRLQLLHKGKDRLSRNRVTFLREAKDKTLWVATEEGLFNINLGNKHLITYTTDNGLPSNLIYTITEDSLNRWWISTSKGLALLNPRTKSIRTFTKSSGLLSDQLNYSSAFQDEQGRLYFGSVKGLISFNPYQLQPDTYRPPVYITNFSVYNKPLAISGKDGPLKKSLLLTDQITLPYNQSTFNIDFAALNFTSPDNVEYAYMLEGLDKSWNYIKTNRSVYFTRLPHGTYTFRVRSTNSSGIWQNNERTLKIIITPPFWKTSLAYVLYSALLAGILFLTIRSYRQYLTNKQKRRMQVFAIEKEKELIEAKIDFFTKVAHEIKTPLTLIKAPLEKITKQIAPTPQTEKYLGIMNRNTERLLELTNQLLDFRKTESEQFSLHLKEMDIPGLLTAIWNTFQPTAEMKNIVFELSVPGTSFQSLIDEDAFTKIISNLLDNAIKYCKTRVTTVLIPPSEEHKNFTIHVINDGEPIPEEERSRIFELFYRSRFTESIPGAGIGLALTKSLLDLHEGTIRLDTTKNLIIFEVEIPARLA